MGINLRSYVLSIFCEPVVTSQEGRMCYFVECHATIVESKCINDTFCTIKVFHLMIRSMMYNTCIPSYDRINYAQYRLKNGSLMYSARIPCYGRVKCAQYIFPSYDRSD